MEVTVSEEQRQVKIKREFVGMIANKMMNKLAIQYREATEVGGIVVTESVKEYSRDYKFWEESQIGVAILQLINADLAKEELQ